MTALFESVIVAILAALSIKPEGRFEGAGE